MARKIAVLCSEMIDFGYHVILLSQDFREKNHDQVREDIITVLRATRSSFIQEVISKSPAALFRWSILRAVVRATFAFKSAPKRCFGTPTHDQRQWRDSSSQSLIVIEIGS